MFSSKEAFKKEYLQRFKEVTGECFEESSFIDRYNVLASLVMKYASICMADSHSLMNREKNQKRLYYFSMEFLVGKLLEMNLMKLGILDVVTEGLNDLGVDIKDLADVEMDAGLGNGGLGRLAACFLDSLAFLNIPAMGMGIKYRYGLFEQKIHEGHQVELPDKWLRYGNQWEIRKASKAEVIRFYGNIRTIEKDGKIVVIHENYETVLAVPFDVPIVSSSSSNVNFLRLWSAGSTDAFDFNLFNKGNYMEALREKTTAEAITQVLYPNDANYEGRLLRLKQQYFFVSAGLRSIRRRYKRNNEELQDLSKKIQIQINDTHPSLVIPELMRILMDHERLEWDEAWEQVTGICAYTNHTILPEALETWPQEMMKCLLPRVYMIIEEIDRRFKEEGDESTRELRARNSILRDGLVHMANLAIIGSKSVNGVAKLHTDILINETFSELYELYPDKFNSKTNGVSHRRFLMKSNPLLTKCINKTIGEEWKDDPARLKNLLDHCGDRNCHEMLKSMKRKNKERLAAYVMKTMEIKLDVNSIFDVHVKRIHEYKRQLLNVLHIMYLYDRIKTQKMKIYPRTFIFAGKAAPSYHMAKEIIKLINKVADKVNNDPEVSSYMKVVFLENFNVTLGELIYPAADVSEQISTASKEASGTGNMKFMMNGAITIGTLDGANVEIMEKAGEDNIFIFGLRSEEVLEYYRNGSYSSREIYASDWDVQRTVDHLIDGFLSKDTSEFRDIYDSLILHNDAYFVMKDFRAYVEAQKEVEKAYRDTGRWFEMSMKNIAASGYFSSDRTIREYDNEIWKIKEDINN
ncbi:starch phosphorylase [Dethiosulfatibacter aminovorans DSM 17477]|uniref:Alpha-1,4 glucan phosphorylase n=1 Tax=Dethiosulfatibacter aminovorans DSM 17477 TaxID=1121476 RepID=A0A1M6ADD2_9FIRM|nr:glycogen/starch/alpha-glucan phosphorylase [Dethiosulfatibacter aminovorans]SHI34421.1 starch phosphorylase [Dethiosulfatibacter aminovorans DSM 17477]